MQVAIVPPHRCKVYIYDLLKSYNAMCVFYQYICVIHDVLFYEILYCHFACNLQEMEIFAKFNLIGFTVMLSASPPQPPKMPGITLICFRLVGYNPTCAVYV